MCIRKKNQICEKMQAWKTQNVFHSMKWRTTIFFIMKNYCTTFNRHYVIHLSLTRNNNASNPWVPVSELIWSSEKIKILRFLFHLWCFPLVGWFWGSLFVCFCFKASRTICNRTWYLLLIILPFMVNKNLSCKSNQRFLQISLTAPADS